jgi:endonuclease-3
MMTAMNSHDGLSRRELKEERRTAEIVDRLGKEYQDATCALVHENAYQLLVATILSAQCTDERVNKVTPRLFETYPDPDPLANAEQEQLQEIIRSTGFFRNKARNLIGAAQTIVSDFDGLVPRTMKELLTLPGVARKTANVVLGTAFGIPSGIVVDTHVSRISQRLELTFQKNPEKIERELMDKVPLDHWIAFSHWVIHHGRRICRARKPQCAKCLLADLCPFNG